MDTVILKSYAKINLSLIIKGIDACGYHLLDSVAASIDIFDKISVTKNSTGQVSIDCDNVPLNQNTAYLSAKNFLAKFTNGSDGLHITIEKGIPFSAGLGGSSADAAGVLRALCRLYGIDPFDDKVVDIAAKSGSDTVYMLSGGFSRLFGRGQILKPFTALKPLNIAVIKPDGGISAAAAYRQYDAMLSNIKKGSNDYDILNTGNNDKLIKKLSMGEVDAEIQALCVNNLQPPAYRLFSEIEDIVSMLSALNPLACFMTGSGTAVCAILETEELALKCCEHFHIKGYYAKACKTLSSGIEFV